MEYISPELKDAVFWFLAKGIKSGRPVHHLKLQHLIYFTYGWSLVTSNFRRTSSVDGKEWNQETIFSEYFEKWKYGPIISELYTFLRSCDISQEFNSFVTAHNKTNTEIYSLYQFIWKNYEKFNVFQLTEMAQTKEGPWYITDELWIPENQFKKYFKKLRIKKHLYLI